MYAKALKRSAFPYLLPALLVLTIVGIVPLGFVLFYSLHDTFGGNVFVWVGDDGFRQVLASSEFYDAVLGSVFFSMIALSVQIPLGIYVALRMPRTGPFVAIGLVLLSIPMLTPQIVVGYLWKVMVQPGSGLLSQALQLSARGVSGTTLGISLRTQRAERRRSPKKAQRGGR